ncbi:MAG TPA: Hsp20/alpha crystallin family protein [Desulfobacterales bacterium]|nr:Hsp20/alpha crystallin family protein [Desulfobacterales bacterium]
MIYRRFYGFPTWESRSPFAELERIRRQMERQLEGWPTQRQTSGVFPLINLTDNKDSFFIRAELPGMSSGDLDMQATSNSVSISGERKIPAENKEARYHRREREAGKFSRVVGLPSEIDPDKVQASMVNGILTVVVPKAQAAKPRQISVR